MALRKNLLKNGLASFLQKLVRVGEQLILVPFFIASWGTAYYGEWLTLTLLPSVIAFSDLGFGSSAANSFVLQYTTGKKQLAADILKTGMSLIHKLIFGGIAASILILAVLWSIGVFEKAYISAEVAIPALAMMILAKLISFYFQIFDGKFRAARKSSTSINLQSGYAIMNIIAGMIVLILGGRVVAYAVSQLAVSLCYFFLYNYLSERALGLGATHIGLYNKEQGQSIAKMGFGYLLSPVWQAIFFQGTTLVVRLVLGPVAVATFNTVRTVTRSVNQLFGMVNSTVFPELQYEIGIGNRAKSVRLFRYSIFLVIAIAIVGSICLWFFGEWAYALWTKNELKVPAMMWQIFIIGILFNAVWWTAGMVFRAYNRPFELSIVGCIAAIISIVFSYFLSKAWDLVGVAIACLILEVIMAIYILPASCRLMGCRVSNLFCLPVKRIQTVLKLNL